MAKVPKRRYVTMDPMVVGAYDALLLWFSRKSSVADVLSKQ